MQAGQQVTIRVEGSARDLTATVTARDEQWLTVELQNGETLRLGYDEEEQAWYDEGESGNRLWLTAA